MVFLMIDVICSTENDVVMNVSFVNVGSYNVRVFSFQKFIGKLYADLMSFLIRYFSGHECLNQMESFVWVCLIGFDRANLKSKAAVSGLHPKEEMRMFSSVFAGLQM